MSNNFMRLLVFFDLPVKTKEERSMATKLRQYLLKDGFYMIQFSLYGRLCNSVENALLHERALLNHLPYAGSVRSMLVTEKQYAGMKILVGTAKKRERSVVENQISFF